jgi:hypothetical protein
LDHPNLISLSTDIEVYSFTPVIEYTALLIAVEFRFTDFGVQICAGAVSTRSEMLIDRIYTMNMLVVILSATMPVHLLLENFQLLEENKHIFVNCINTVAIPFVSYYCPNYVTRNFNALTSTCTRILTLCTWLPTQDLILLKAWE